jgi:HK97 family phage major capsid protein
VKFAVEGEEDEDDDEDEDEDAADAPEVKGMDIKSVRALINGSLDQASKKYEKRMEKFASDLASKFLEGVSAQRAKAADEPVKKDEKADDTTRKFIKALISGDRAAAKALTTTTPAGESPDDSAAGLLIPTELMTEVLRLKEEYGVARREMRYLPFSGPGNSRTLPALGTSVSVNWTGEGARKKSSQPKFSLVTQTLKKLTGMCPLTEEILEDVAINLTSLVGELFAEAITAEEDSQFFTGDGTVWTGILNNTSVTKKQQASGGVTNLDADDLLDLKNAVPASVRKNGKFYLSSSVLAIVQKLKGTDGHYIWKESPSDSQPGTIWGRPYELVDSMPEATEVVSGDQYVIYGDLKKGAIYGDKGAIRVKLLDQATITDTDDETNLNLAEQDMIAMRITQRVGYVVAVPAAIAVLEAQETQS